MKGIILAGGADLSVTLGISERQVPVKDMPRAYPLSAAWQDT
jgi:hypothetical protein